MSRACGSGLRPPGAPEATQAAGATRKVALVGSSGGGAATTGHTRPELLVEEIERQLGTVRLAAVQLVCTRDGAGLDGAKADESPCVLLVGMAEDGALRLERFAGTLAEVNERARAVDTALAAKLRNKGLDGLICVSADPMGANASVAKAVVARMVPVVGTGGSSMSALAAMGANVVHSGGSVATTRFTRAVVYAHAMCRALGVQHQPVVRWVGRPSVHSALCSILPGAMAVALLRSVGDPHYHEWFDLSNLVPIMAASAVAHGRAGEQMGPPALLAGVIAGAAAASLPGAVLAGWLVAEVLPRVLCKLMVAGLPSTACTIFATVAAVVAAVPAGMAARLVFSDLAEFGLVPLLAELPSWIVGPAAGVAMCWGSKVGLYHRVALPLILLEMQHGAFGFVGALDLCALVLVSAGVCCAVLATPAGRGAGPDEDRQEAAARSLAWRGASTNLLLGDFVEACYPFMEADWAVSASGYAGSAAAGAILFRQGLKSATTGTAYLPCFVAVGLSNRPVVLLAAAGVAFAVPFVTTLARRSSGPARTPPR